MLADGKQFYEQAHTYMALFTAVLGLAAIGVRHRRLRAQVRKVLARRNSPIFDPERTLPGMSELADAFTGYCEEVLTVDEDMQTFHRDLGAKFLVHGTRHLPEGHRLRFDREDDVPGELAFWLPLSMEANLLGDGQHLQLMGSLLPWLAHAKAEDLYLPEAMVRDYKAPWVPDDTRAQLESHWQHNRVFRPGVRAKPGRNEPCLCGSGKKYKHCCYG